MNESQSDMQLREAEKGEKGEMAAPRPSAARALARKVGVVWESKRAFAIGLLVALVGALSISLAITATQASALKAQQQASGDDVCLTEECTVAAAHVLESVDMTVDPCTDFYAYACGGFNEKYRFPGGANSVSRFSLAQQSNDMRMINILGREEGDEPAGEMLPGTQSEAFQKARRYFNECLNLKELDERGVEPIEDLLDIVDDLQRAHFHFFEAEPTEFEESIGGNSNSAGENATDGLMTMMRAASNTDPKLDLVFDAVRALHEHHISAFVELWVGKHPQDASEHILNVRQGKLGLPDPGLYRIKEDSMSPRHRTQMAVMMEGYKGVLEEGLRLLDAKRSVSTARSVETFVESFSAYSHDGDGGGDGSSDKSTFSNDYTSEDIERLLDFESQLAGCHVSRANLQIPLLRQNPMDLEAAEHLFPVGWSGLIEELSGHANYSREINIETPSALVCMTRVLGEASLDDIARHLKISILLHRAHLLDSDLRDWRYKFEQITTGNNAAGPRWRQCLGMVQSVQSFGFAVSKAYVASALRPDTRAEVKAMAENIEDAFMAKLLSAADWMDGSTKAVAKEKSETMAQEFGYPDWVMDDDKVSRFFEDVEIEPGKFYEGAQSLKSAYLQRKFALLFGNDEAKQEERDMWKLSPTEINAYYAPATNTIAFPAGILNPPFFTAGAPLPLNYGAIGTFIAHEFSHAFDSSGRQYDPEGELNDWWTPESDAIYAEKEACFVDQYSRYEYKGQRLNGNLTLTENIADNVGLDLAYRTLQEALGPEHGKRLPSTPWSPDQLFFLGFAQSWCDSISGHKARTQIASDEHTLPKFRVNGAVSNSEAFEKAFQCKNKVNKCNLF